jgi:2-phosphoglycerate kinase
MKTYVSNENDDSRVPFLRGILTRSLIEAGLEFEDAFELAAQVRERFKRVPEISPEQIREATLELLAETGHTEAVEPYQLQVAAPEPIRVEDRSGIAVAFSRAKHERYLQGSGLKAGRAEQITNLIYEQLLSAGVSSLSSGQLGYLTYRCLRQEVSRKAAKRYLAWSEFQRSGRPLLLLISGAVGSGKSTIATEAAHLLEIVRIQSTDMLREVMRMMLPEQLLPVLHTSSFNAWRALPGHDAEDRDPEMLVAEGYQSQARLLAVPCEAVLQRANRESVSIILEGVHAHPGLLACLPDETDAISVHVMLAVLQGKELKSRLHGRSAEAPSRRSERYLGQFDSVWRLQSFLLSEADRFDVPIIANEDKGKTVSEIVLHVNYQLRKRFKGSATDVFGLRAADFGCGEKNDWRELVPALAG